MIAILPILAVIFSLAILISLARPNFLPAESSDARKISIIIPARNEEANLEVLLTSLKQQDTGPLEIIVIDDQSDDNTAAVARKHGAVVVSGKELPDGWKGKTWACQQGADAATGDWLLFLDADLKLLPGSLGKLAALTTTKAVHSLCPYHRVHQGYEQLSAYFNAITLAGVDAFAATPSQQATLFGQVLLIHRDHYRDAGGHEAVRKEILENYQLAKRLEQNEVEIRHYLGKDAVEMRMFPEGIRQLIQSWKKGFLAGATQAPARALITTSLWLTGGMVLTGCLLTIFLFPPFFIKLTLAASLLYAVISFFPFRLAGNFSPFAILFFPIPLLFYQGLFFISLLDQKRGRSQTWKGRSID